MYCTVQEVAAMLKPDMTSAIIGDSYISDETERTQKLAEITAAAIADACAEIDGYLAKRYPVPLAAPPAVITKYAKDITVYNLVSRMGVATDNREDNYRERYKFALKFLQLVAEGKVALGVGGEVPDKQAQAGFRLEGARRTFSRRSTRGM